jgi:hypothetical protein
MSNTQRSNIFQFKSATNNSLVTITSTDSNLATFHSTGSITLPTGSSLDRPALPNSGMIRYNTDLLALEFYNGGGWVALNGVPVSNTYQVPFTQTTTVLPISGGAFTGRVLNVTVLVETPFDGVGFSFDLGTNVTPTLLLADGLIDLTTANTNNYAIVNKAIVGETIEATINAGTGSLGTGVVIVEFAL